ncbi:hypothetical protein STPH1_1634 [Streptomyces sp. OM5714]|nr:hypothetical protein STPH1_1634 [Streptomyces sp. OM5714]
MLEPVPDEVEQSVQDSRSRCESAGEPRGDYLQQAPRGELRETGRARPASPEKPTKTAGQCPFAAGSKIATHSTCDVIGKMSAWTQTVKQQVRGVFGFQMRASGHPERQMSVTAVRRLGMGNCRAAAHQSAKVPIPLGIPGPYFAPLCGHVQPVQPGSGHLRRFLAARTRQG